MPKPCGTSTAAASPCSAREATSTSADQANEQSAEETTNPASPSSSIRFRPNMSPSRAPAISPTASASVYAAATHSSDEVVIDRSAWIAGAATLTIVESRMLRTIAERITAKPAHMCLGTGGVSAAGVTVSVSGGASRVVIECSFVGCAMTSLHHCNRHVPFLMGSNLGAMAETSGRLLKLLSLLQTPREWPGPELARRLGVSQRTVRNDVGRLRDLGYPVQATRGSIGGYRLSAGTAMPPLLLDDDEAVAIAVALSTASGGAVDGMEETALRALTKLLQVLPKRLRGRVDALQAHTVRVAGRRRGADVDGKVLALLAGAARDREVTRFAYSDHCRRGDRAPGRALPARQLGPSLVPGRVRRAARRLAHVPRRPDGGDPLGRPPVRAARPAGGGHRRLRRLPRPGRCR